MKRTVSSVSMALFAALVTVPLSARSEIYDPAETFSIQNGNPNGVWAYGWMDTAFATFTLYVNAGFSSGVNPHWYGWGSNWTPSIWRNDANLTGICQPGWLHLHPGNGNQGSVLRWTAPRAGHCRAEGRFLPGDYGTMQVGVRHNTDWLWQATNAGAFTCEVDVVKGDVLAFTVYGGYSSGTTPLSVLIDGPSAPATRYVNAASATPVSPYLTPATPAPGCSTASRSRASAPTRSRCVSRITSCRRTSIPAGWC